MRDEAMWAEAWAALGLAPPAGVLADLRARYDEPQRAYHTRQHLRECFAHLDAARSYATRLAELTLALWFHDAVYDPHASDNEARSARLAADVLERAGAAADVVDRVTALIDATAHVGPAWAGTDPDCALLLDIDLAILGAPADRFAEYERQVRSEYAWVPAPVYRAARREILGRFLARPAIFRTPAFAGLEAPARANLAAALVALA